MTHTHTIKYLKCAYHSNKTVRSYITTANDSVDWMSLNRHIHHPKSANGQLTWEIDLGHFRLRWPITDESVWSPLVNADSTVQMLLTHKLPITH